MDKQPITGYRNLMPEEVALINEIKAAGNDLKALIEKVEENQRLTTEKYGTGDAEGYRWAAVARTQLQQGMMALVRAVAKPEGF